jgi:DNA-binding winged helix-turn-helix (wHTH) protein
MGGAGQTRVLKFGRFRLQTDGCILSYGDKTVPLPPKCGSMLLLLLENAGRVVSKEDLMQKIWPDTFVGDSSLTRSISDLRKILARYDPSQDVIATVSKRGYRWTASVDEIRQNSTLPAGKLMLAVLPFSNLSAKRSQEYLSDGLTEEMITQLGKINPEQLGVIGRSRPHFRNAI